ETLRLRRVLPRALDALGDRDPPRFGRFLRHGPQGARSAQDDARAEPFHTGSAGLGRVPPDRAALREARARGRRGQVYVPRAHAPGPGRYPQLLATSAAA